MRALPVHGAPPPEEPAATRVGGVAFPVLAKGFRPFFILAAALSVCLYMPLWLVAHRGTFSVDGDLAPMFWHVVHGTRWSLLLLSLCHRGLLAHRRRELDWQ